MQTIYRVRRIISEFKNRFDAWRTYRLPHPRTTFFITDKRIARIATRGFFSIFLETLDLIAAHGDKEVTIDFRHTPYNESRDENMWTQYFEPVENQVRRRYDLSFLPVRAYRYRRIKEDARLLHLLHDVLADRVRVQPDILEKAAAFRRERLPEARVIGVHIRGTDHIRMYGDRIDLDRYFSEVDRLLSSGYTQVFLATDDARFYRAFVERYGERLVSYGSHRTESGQGVHFENSAPREIGEEVVIDWLLLAGTQYFIHGESNVATAVLIRSPDLPHANMAI